MNDIMPRLRVVFKTLSHLDSLIVAGEPPGRLRGKLNVAMLEVEDMLRAAGREEPSIGADVPGGGAI